MIKKENFPWPEIKLSILRHHAHPISVHVPNGVLPVSVLFLVAAFLFHSESLELAALFNLLFVFLCLPVVLVTGIVEWKERYGGRMSKLFKKKIISAATVSVLTTVLVVWRLVTPDMINESFFVKLLYLFTHGLLLAAAISAGYWGGKVAFQLKDTALEKKLNKLKSAP